MCVLLSKSLEVARMCFILTLRSCMLVPLRKLTIKGSPVETIEEFTYLGSKVSQSGGADEDITARIKKARQTFAILRPVWKSTAISSCTKVQMFNSNVKSVLLYMVRKHGESSLPTIPRMSKPS